MKTILILAALALTGCSLTVSSDGSKSATVDGASLIRVAEIYATK